MSKSKITFRHVFKTIIWPRKKLLFIGLILIIVSTLAGLVLPASSKYLFDDIIANRRADELLKFLGVVTASIIVNAIASYLLTQLLSVEAQRYISILRADVQKHLRVNWIRRRFRRDREPLPDRRDARRKHRQRSQRLRRPVMSKELPEHR